MKHIFKSLLLAAAVLALAACAKEETGSHGGEDTAGPVIVNASSAAIDGEIILKFKNEASGIVEKTRAAGAVPAGSGIDEIDRVLTSVGTVRFERLFPAGGRFEERTRKEGLHLWYYAQYDPSVPTSEMARMLSACKDIAIIEYSLPAVASDYMHTPAPTGDPGPTRAVSDEVRDIPFPFNEDERAQLMQWHYNNTGNVYAQQTRMGADANVYAAWQLATGNPDVIVAVIDQGVKYDHEDLAANMWVNTGEIPGNGIDDDGNGYVDDIYGFNFTNNSGELNFSQELMHGTHVAGTIAAVNNNGIGVNGIAGGSGRNDGVKIMSCEILGKSESGSSGAGLSGQIRAFKYAADNGAVICQNSWGYTAGTISETDWKNGTYSALTRAIQYFNKYAGLDENGNQTGPMAGGIVVFAAGNDASNENCYPAADANVVSVGALSYLGTPSYYTNYGKWVSMSAPGGDLMLSNAYGGVYSTSVAADGGSAYEGIQGTSMACPHVSGACALAISYYYGAEKRKGLTGEMLRQALLSSTQPVDRFCTGNYAGYEGMMGIGRLDTYKLLLTIAKMDGIPAQKVAAGATVSLDLRDYFLSANILGYTVSDPGVIGVSLQSGVMQIKGLRKGEATVIVSDGAAIRKPVEVTVE